MVFSISLLCQNAGMRVNVRTIVEFILRYTFWLAAVAGGFYLMLRIRTSVLLTVVRASGGSPRQAILGLIDKGSLIVIAIALIVCVGVIEYYLMRAKNLVGVIHRFALVIGIELLVLALNDTLLQIVVGIEYRSTLSVIAFLAELILGGLLVSHTTWWPKLFGRRQPISSPK